MSGSNGIVAPGTMANEEEMLARATRRRFTAQYKLKMLREAEACTELGGIVVAKLDRLTRSMRDLLGVDQSVRAGH